MKKITLALSAALSIFLLLTASAVAQTALTQTTLSALIGTNPQNIPLASVTGITANQTLIYIDQEAIFINTVNSTSVSGFRGYGGTPVSGHVSGARVLIGPASAFNPLTRGITADGDPVGQCTVANTLYTPYVNIKNGRQWLCSSVLTAWVPGWGNTSQAAAPTAAVASAAGQITPSGPLFHITGALAITGFVIPVGFPVKSGASFCVIPDGTFTTTTANNIALASTAVVNKTLCWTYDTANAKFTPSY